jgi:hypothetical protein
VTTLENYSIPDRWETCAECQAMGKVHVARAELEADPVGTWRQLWRDGSVAVRWFDHPCDARYDPRSPDERDWPRAWAVFGPWGVDEVGHIDMRESDRIDPGEALTILSRLSRQSSDEEMTDQIQLWELTGQGHDELEVGTVSDDGTF